MRDEIDHKDLLILSTFYKNPATSVRDICALVLIKAPSAVMYRLRKLEELELLAPPPEGGMHRSRKITSKGTILLEKQGLLKHANRT
jgi:predicted MarR family transcription regulator